MKPYSKAELLKIAYHKDFNIYFQSGIKDTPQKGDSHKKMPPQSKEGSQRKSSTTK